MEAACRVPNKVVRKATRVPSVEGAGDQAWATESRWRILKARSSGAAQSSAMTASIECLPPPAVLLCGVAERDLRVSETCHGGRQGLPIQGAFHADGIFCFADVRRLHRRWDG